MLQKILNILAYTLCAFIMIYLIILTWWLFLPLFLILSIIVAWRIIQARRLWNQILKQSKQQHHKKKLHIISDDTIIDAEYEEIKTK